MKRTQQNQPEQMQPGSLSRQEGRPRGLLQEADTSPFAIGMPACMCKCHRPPSIKVLFPALTFLQIQLGSHAEHGLCEHAADAA